MRLPEIKEPNLVKLTQIVNSGSGTVGLEFQCLSEDPLWLEGGDHCCSLARLVYPIALLFLTIYHCLSDTLFVLYLCFVFSSEYKLPESRSLFVLAHRFTSSTENSAWHFMLPECC